MKVAVFYVHDDLTEERFVERSVSIPDAFTTADILGHGEAVATAIEMIFGRVHTAADMADGTTRQ